MQALARLKVVVVTAALTLFSATAWGVAGPDVDYSISSDSPSNGGKVCLTGDCTWFFTYSTQVFDCSKAGTGVPQAIAGANTGTNYADLGYFAPNFYSNADPAAADLNNDGMIDQADFEVFQSMMLGLPQGEPPIDLDFSDLAAPLEGGWPNQLPDAATSDPADEPAEQDESPNEDEPPSTAPQDTSSMKGGMQTGAGQTMAQGSLSFSLAGGAGEQLAGGEAVQFKLFPQDEAIGANAWPGEDAASDDYGHDSGPVAGIAPGTWSLGVDWKQSLTLSADYYDSVNVESSPGALRNSGLDAYLTQTQIFNGTQFATLQFPASSRSMIDSQLGQVGGIRIQPNWCRRVLVPEDPNFRRTGRHGGNSWGEQIDDQWAIKRVGFSDDEYSAWDLVPDSIEPIVVAVIDTGLDWHHRDIDPASIWRNPGEVPGNGIDDDRNGYVDDVIGWNFLAQNNRPWDHDGHGTVVAGIIAAAHNDVGIAGINPRARIMVLKGINNFGTTRASYVAEAIKYAADNGARIINLSVGGARRSDVEDAAIAYAHSKGVLVLAAAGNEGIELDDYGPGGDETVMTIGATYFDDRSAAFSNFGDAVDLAAPGVDVLSLRARFTDANHRPSQAGNLEEYRIGEAFVGDDKRYFHASGTSFSTPIVAGVASLIMGKEPQLTAAEVRKVLEQTATDVDLVGRDKYTGHGMVDARAALGASPGQFVTAEISGIRMLPAEAPAYIEVLGTIDASDFKRAWVQIGPGENPGAWRYVGQKRKFPIRDGRIASFPLNSFTQSGTWLIVVNVEDANGVVRRATYPVEIR